MPTNNEPRFPHSPLTSEAASQYGYADHELRSANWPARHRGVHRWVDRDPIDPTLRLEEVARILPVDAALTGWAAIYKHAQETGQRSWLDGMAHDGTLLPIPIAMKSRVQTRRRTGLTIIRSDFDDSEVDIIDGIPVLNACRATYDGARYSSLEDAVVMVDTAAHFGLVTLDDVTAYVEEHRKGHGNPRVRKALELADPRVLSPQESRMRVVWMVDAGLPRPQVNIPVYDSAGNFVASPDMLDEEAGVAAEYDGSEFHAGLWERTSDQFREGDVERVGLIMLRLTSLNLTKYRRATAQRMRAERRRGLARDRSRDRWTTTPIAA